MYSLVVTLMYLCYRGNASLFLEIIQKSPDKCRAGLSCLELHLTVVLATGKGGHHRFALLAGVPPAYYLAISVYCCQYSGQVSLIF